MTLGDGAQTVHPLLPGSRIGGAQLQHIARRTADGERARVLVAGTHHGIGQMRLTARRLAVIDGRARLVSFAQVVAEGAGGRVDGEPAVLPTFVRGKTYTQILERCVNNVCAAPAARIPFMTFVYLLSVPLS